MGGLGADEEQLVDVLVELFPHVLLQVLHGLHECKTEGTLKAAVLRDELLRHERECLAVLAVVLEPRSGCLICVLGSYQLQLDFLLLGTFSDAGRQLREAILSSGVIGLRLGERA